MNNKNLISGAAVASIVLIAGVFFWNTTRAPIQVNEEKELPNSTTGNMNNALPQGLQIEIITEGSGVEATKGQTLIVDYTGMLTDGTVFDSSIPRGQPFPVRLGAGEVIAGWDLGLEGMKVGEKRKLTIAPELGYGASGFPGVIPPNATLVFEVELKAIQ